MATGFWLWEKTFVPDRAAHKDVTALPLLGPLFPALPEHEATERPHAARPWGACSPALAAEGQERQISSQACQETP